MPKVRLVKGPFSGKVMEITGLAGQNRVAVAGPKPMSRKQKYEYQAEQYRNVLGYKPFPHIRAEYQIAMTMFAGHSVPCTHPDGSYFYTYVEGSKKEF